MKDTHRIITIIGMIIIFLIPLIGSMHLLLRVFIRQAGKLSHEKGSGVIGVAAKTALIIILILYGLFLLFFLICLTWFPDCLPPFWKLVGIIASVPYFCCILGIYYGLGPAVTFGNLPSSRILGEIFRSGRDETEKKRKE